MKIKNINFIIDIKNFEQNSFKVFLYNFEKICNTNNKYRMAIFLNKKLHLYFVSKFHHTSYSKFRQNMKKQGGKVMKATGVVRKIDDC